jgi:prepilin-type N-terminal cleavage/methylation domain-containing protein
MTPTNQTTGFTLIELLIVLVVFSILIGGIFSFFISQRDTYLAEDLALERDQNLRMALETISRELSRAGHRAADPAFVEGLSKWVPSKYLPTVPMAVTLDANPKITFGEGALPDVVTVVCAVSTAANPTTLSEDSSGTKLNVSLSNSDSKKQYKAGDILSIGYLPEYAGVAIVDGNIVIIDTDPEVPDLQPLSKVHPAGSPVVEISIVSFAVFNDENDPGFKRHEAGRSLLKRKVNAGGFYPVAENISQLKVETVEDGVLAVSLTARADPIRSGGLDTGEVTLTSRVLLRNGVAAGFASDCINPAAPGGLVLEDGLNDAYPCRVKLSWNPVTVDASGNSLEEAGCPVTGYRIYFDGVSGVFGHHRDVSAEDTSGVVLDVSAVSAAEFYISVAAESSGGFGEKSSEAVITDTTAPEKPTGVSTVALGAHAIAVSWDENVECDLAGYYLYREKNGGNTVLATGLIPAGAGGYTDPGLVSGATYTYMVEAVDCGFNVGERSEGVTVTLE